MASKSRAAQERLAELEKLSAPFEEQLEKAAKFVGVDLDTIGRYTQDSIEGGEKSRTAIYHGREEWLLKWLLKKLQTVEPRNTPSSWRLLSYLLQVLPQSTAARALIEKKFTTILRQTLEEARKSLSDINLVEAPLTSSSGSEEEEKPQKSSKKRKHTGELVGNPSSQGGDLPDLIDAIFSAMDLVMLSTKLTTSKPEEGMSSAFSAEYMKTVVRTAAEEAATILGSWVSLSQTALENPDPDTKHFQGWLTPFIEIWNSHAPEDTSLVLFSRHCTQPILSLLRAVKEGKFPKVDWVPQLEQLISQNIMNPAKMEKWKTPDSDLLSRLTKVSVLQDTANTPQLFEVAIRSIQPHGSRRRRPNDDTWLQTVFKTLKDAMPPQTAASNGKNVGAMLQCAIDHKLSLDLADLRTITSEYALPEGREDWELLATIIKLDANVFLIPNDEQDSLKELLERITKFSIDDSWPQLSDQVVSDVLVPLMGEFAKARDLSGFLRHWLAQLVEFEKLRKEAMRYDMDFGAWEDDALQAQLGKLLEPSLTLQQITQILDWLSTQVTEHPDAVCVLLEAIAGSIHHEEVVDAVGLRLYHIMFDNGVSDKLNLGRHKWRSWRILSRSLNWLMASDIDELAQLWQRVPRVKPFKSLSSKATSNIIGNTDKLETLEVTRFICAAWNSAGKDSPMEVSCKPFALNVLRQLAQDIKWRTGELKGGEDLGSEVCGLVNKTLEPGFGWTTWASVECVFVDYPKILELGLEMDDKLFKEMLQDTFWIASASVQESSVASIDWLRLNPNAFPELWMSILHSEDVLYSEPLLEILIDTMLQNQTNISNPIIKSASTNGFAVKSLLQLPVSLVQNKKTRDRILRSWLPTGDSATDDAQGLSYKSTALDPAVLSLKIKFMQRPVLYEGMNFKELVHLADTLAEAEIPSQQVNLALLKELSRLTFVFVHTNIDQPPQKAYISDAFKQIQKKVEKASEKKKYRLNYAMTMIFGAAFSAFHTRAAPLNDLEVIAKDDLDSITSTFKDGLLEQLKEILHKSRKEKSTKRKTSQVTEHLTILSIIDALAALGVDSSKLAELEDDAKAFCYLVQDTDLHIGKRLETFLAVHGPNVIEEELLGGDVSTVNSRQSITQKTVALTTGKDRQAKLKLLDSIFGPGLVGLSRLDKLLAARQVIISIEDTRKSAEEERDEDDEKENGTGFDLSEAYSILCCSLWKASGVRQFCAISETLELMLRTKGRSMTQFNIDTTLGSITILCSRNSPPLRPSRSGTIYLHLCRLLQSVLTHHRLKLQGHFHLVVQVMQSLLRLLFTPLPHSTAKALKHFGSPPSWLSSPKHQLNAKHAAAFTRLVTLICDPSVSSIRGSQHNNLMSATDKAKRMAGQHMQFVLTTYIKLQLEMRILPEIREKMVPGLYAIFDTTTPELRRVINDGLDASGRAVFATLYRDYARFGKWKGN